MRQTIIRVGMFAPLPPSTLSCNNISSKIELISALAEGKYIATILEQYRAF